MRRKACTASVRLHEDITAPPGEWRMAATHLMDSVDAAGDKCTVLVVVWEEANAHVCTSQADGYIQDIRQVLSFPAELSDDELTTHVREVNEERLQLRADLETARRLEPSGAGDLVPAAVELSRAWVSLLNTHGLVALLRMSLQGMGISAALDRVAYAVAALPKEERG